MDEATQHAVISGGGGFLGRAVEEALQMPGWTIDAPGSGELDVREESSVRAFLEHRQVDLLVCAAGITRDAPLLKITEAAWEETWDVNFKGALRCASTVLPGMTARGHGHIVLISSFSAHHPPAGQSAYAAAKAALLGLVTDLAQRHGPSNIRVNAILPGFLETRMTERLSETRRAQILEAHTLGRFNTCARVAEFIRFLHHEMPHTSGQAFQLDSRTDFPRFCQQ